MTLALELAMILILAMAFAIPFTLQGIGYIIGSSINYTIVYYMMFANSLNTATVYKFV